MKKGIVRVGLYRERAWWTRLDVLPFALVYSVLHAMAWAPEQQEEVPLWLLIVIPLALALHGLTHLCTHWSIGCRALVAYSKVKYVREATHVRAKPPRNAGAEEMVPLERVVGQVGAGKEGDAVVRVVGSGHGLPYARFSFQKTTFCFRSPDALASEYDALAYPTQGAVCSFLSGRGHARPDDVALADRIWGENVFDIPMPTFTQLFKEHAVAPFFVFQVVCVLLWSLDDLWYYSMLTLVLLVVFESAVCNQRQRSLETLRAMRRPAYPVFVFRCGSWQLLSTEALLPGDLVSLGQMSTHQQEKAGGGGGSKARTQGGKVGRRTLDMQQEEEGEGGASTSERLAPCDLLLVRGSCIVNEAMLTGESTPQLKEALEPATAEEGKHLFDLGAGVSGDLDVRTHVVFGGTKILQLAYSKDAASTTTNGGQQSPSGSVAGGNAVKAPPDKGCVAFVLRTGFETSQGQLMRTIIFATRQVSVGSAETVVFILILLVFALLASAYVLNEGLKDEDRNRFKLLLHCIMIITSVVPPELPMELSLAVTNSLAALTKSLVFCTEPFRIPLAGKVTVCCFDKTGTLTSDDLVLQGVAHPAASSSTDEGQQGKKPVGEDTEAEITPPPEIRGPALWVLGSCHALMRVGGKLVGDPMERSAVEGVKWTLSGSGDTAHPNLLAGGSAVSRKGPDFAPIRIHHRYPFSSALRRMSVLVTRGMPDGSEMVALLTKGAPETVRPLLKQVPSDYDDTFLHHMSRGRRVLALAYRVLDGEKDSLASARQLSREQAESGLSFAGFMIVDCPLKKDSRDVIKALQASRHRTVMITGDGALTAVEVARQLAMVPQQQPDRTLRLASRAGGKGGDGPAEMVWEVMTAHQDAKKPPPEAIKLDLSAVEALARDFSLCVEGEALAALIATWQQQQGEGGKKPKKKAGEEADSAAEGGKPQQAVVVSGRTLRQLSRLCPHVTVYARVAPDQKEVIIDALNAAGETTLMCGDGTNDVGALKRAHVGVSIINSPELEKRSDRRSAVYEQRLSVTMGSGEETSKLAKMLAELKEQEHDPTIVQLGDASIASPFTARRTSVDCVLSVIRQGRCTLVTTLQVYKILALNCLVSAYMLSSLYLFGIKQGDLQMTVLGLSVAVLFFFVSRAEPLEQLSAERPPSRIFCAQVCVSIVLQFAVHLSALLYTLHLLRPHIRMESPSMAPDGPFHPTLINSAVFLLSAVMQLNTFIANYRGHPFMQSLSENMLLGRFTIVLYALLALLALELAPPLNHLLQLSPFPSLSLRLTFLGLLVVDTLAVVAIEQACLVLFKGG